MLVKFNNSFVSMKLIGLLGGTSWPSTMLYYEKLNSLVNKQLGGFNSARILLYSIAFDVIKPKLDLQCVEACKLLLQ